MSPVARIEGLQTRRHAIERREGEVDPQPPALPRPSTTPSTTNFREDIVESRNQKTKFRSSWSCIEITHEKVNRRACFHGGVKFDGDTRGQIPKALRTIHGEVGGKVDDENPFWKR